MGKFIQINSVAKGSKENGPRIHSATRGRRDERIGRGRTAKKGEPPAIVIVHERIGDE